MIMKKGERRVVIEAKCESCMDGLVYSEVSGKSNECSVCHGTSITSTSLSIDNFAKLFEVKVNGMFGVICVREEKKALGGPTGSTGPIGSTGVTGSLGFVGVVGNRRNNGPEQPGYSRGGEGPPAPFCPACRTMHWNWCRP